MLKSDKQFIICLYDYFVHINRATYSIDLFSKLENIIPVYKLVIKLQLKNLNLFHLLILFDHL